MTNATESLIFFNGELLERAIDSDYLAKRMELNKSFQAYDFGRWTMEHLNPQVGFRVLEVGCGRGTQSISVSDIIGQSGEISLIDLSRESVDYVLRCLEGKVHARGICGGMDDLSVLLGHESQAYDLAYSVYALYYANNPYDVLTEMYKRLKSGGNLCVVGPDGPHGLVEIVRRIHDIPLQVDNSFIFRSKFVEPFFKENFQEFKVAFLKNPQSITDANLLVEFYRQTTYYDKYAENALRSFAENKIAECGQLTFNKYSYAVTGKKI